MDHKVNSQHVFFKVFRILSEPLGLKLVFDFLLTLLVFFIPCVCCPKRHQVLHEFVVDSQSFNSYAKGGGIAFPDSVDVRSLLDKIVHYFGLSGTRCLVQRRPPVRVSPVQQPRILLGGFLQRFEVTSGRKFMDVGLRALGKVFGPSVGKISQESLLSRRSRQNVGRHIWVVAFRLLALAFSPTLDGLEMDKDVGHVASLQGKGSPVNERMGLVEDHVPGFHCDVDGFPGAIVDLEGPGLVHVLRHVDNATAH
mmetsp:Transcript_18383/g.42199  ORF Transcript_18383/g.42199 Transcript_18383/m.42199 type:complete len:253 (-) Transcript_18383:930-1688(-)